MSFKFHVPRFRLSENLKRELVTGKGVTLEACGSDLKLRTSNSSRDDASQYHFSLFTRYAP